jgi:1-deoxy-D-xylulose-5-phosphate reductoisomerase
MTRKVVVLGSTGSVGRQALDVIAAHPDLFELVGLVAGSNETVLAEQAGEHGNVPTALGVDGAVEFATLGNADVVLNAIVGAAGLKASLAALDAGKVLALANKESLIAGGDLCLAAAERGGGVMIPVDSEHAAIAQALQGHDRATVARLHITASGGPFRERVDLSDVTPEDALAHPTWSMGPKITIDSATLMNKGFEVIEAHFLFGFGYDEIEVTVHPESVIHGMVEFVDGSLLMQAGPTDMRIPIQAALSHPYRINSGVAPLDPRTLGELHFTPVDDARFPAVTLAYEVGRRGGTFAAAMNAANEVAVRAFLDGLLSFTDIVAVVREVVDRHVDTDSATLDGVLAADASAREAAQASIDQRAPVGTSS